MSYRIRIFHNGVEYDVPGTVMTLHIPRGINRELGWFTYDTKEKAVYFVCKDGSQARTPDSPQLLEERTIAEEFGVWDGSQKEPNTGRPVFWLAEFVRPER